MRIRALFIYTFLLLIIASLFLYVTSSLLDARVTGICSNCHTMHASQDGNSTEPNPHLTTKQCLGCHTNFIDGNTILIIGSGNGASRVPIVYNTAQPPDNPLAGGNFYWAKQDPTKGHNVYGIYDPNTDPPDPLTEAPGSLSICSDPESCHITLAGPRSGCKGCHTKTYHHESVTGEIPYRFLTGAGQHYGPDNYVRGIEDDDWEATKSASDHNGYLGNHSSASDRYPSYQYLGYRDGTKLRYFHNMSAFCKGCHVEIHEQKKDENAMLDPNSPWVRHPSDAVLPNRGEYSAYRTYDPNSPVARREEDLFTVPVDPAIVTPGRDMVMCLSCHRPHGTPYPDILRWDYDQVLAGDSSQTDKCFTCHTRKNGT